MPDPIDAVIMWVDGDDPVHASKREKYLGVTLTPGAAATRFSSLDEVVYCVLSILKHASFFSNVYIVTDAQTPPIFAAVTQAFPEQLHKIKIIDHKDIFKGYEKYLPSFNSTSIISVLHKIPDLKDQFVFFNDDFFITHDVTHGDFFENGKPVLRGGWMGRSLQIIESIREKWEVLRRTPKDQRRLSSKRWMMKSAHLAGYKTRTFITTHAPYPMRKITLEKFEEANPEVWAKNVSYKVRSPDQFVAEALANHLELAQDNAITKDRHALVYIRADRINVAKTIQKLTTVEGDANAKFLCIQSLDQASPEVQSLLLEWLEDKYKT